MAYETKFIINPCDFCLLKVKGDCNGERKQEGDTECQFHWCTLPDAGCRFNQEPECFGYDACPNVTEFYNKTKPDM